MAECSSSLSIIGKSRDNIYPPITSEIEEKFVTIGGVSSPSPIFSKVVNPNTPNNSILLNKKKVRRRSRSNKLQMDKVLSKNASIVSMSVDEFNQMNSISVCDSSSVLSQFFMEMKITAVTNQTTGTVLQIKQQFGKRINTKNFKYLNESNFNLVTPCNCNCHTKNFVNNVPICTDEKCENDSTDTSNGSPQPNISLANGLNLQFEKVNESSQNNMSTRLQKLKKTRGKRGAKRFLEMHLNKAEISHGLEIGQLIEGTLRISAKNFREAYVSSKKDDENDYFIPTVPDRNRALDGDIVVIKLKPEEEWTERLKTAFVVYISERVHPRTAVGFLHPCSESSAKGAFLIPRDLRVPKMRIPFKSCPQGFLRHSHRFENILFKGKIVEWNSIKYAQGVLLDSLGFAGDLESETCAILADCGLDVTPFKAGDLESSNITDSIPIEEFIYREDLRHECIFTIDPLTARDLDDAVSCKRLKNGNFEVGVHISDVSFYLPENSPLDKIVCKKATTIYMINNVYHMLPQELCLHCSLLPGKDKLAFSVLWEMTESGEILKQRFCRTVINSCVQLAYEHAQDMIENPDRILMNDKLSQIYGGFTQRDLTKVVNDLQTIAVNLRKKRIENGALRIDQTKILFRIDESSGEPSDLFVYESKEANRLIEEFMLLANICVATKIANTYPDKAFLRCHDPPKMHMLVELQKTLKNFNLDLDISSSKALQSSLSIFGERFGSAQMAVLYHLLAKPMVRARYFCSGDPKSNDFTHYALSVPIYTHFTSPIRRYADIMVHRLLSASLNYIEVPNWSSQHVTSIANNCNKQKYSAKCAGEASSDLYLAHYVSDHQPFVRDAVVIDVKQSSFEILVYSTGSIIKLLTNALGKGVDCEANEADSKKLTITFEETSELPQLIYEIKLFSIVKVALHRKLKSIKLEATLVRPVLSEVYTQIPNVV